MKAAGRPLIATGFRVKARMPVMLRPSRTEFRRHPHLHRAHYTFLPTPPSRPKRNPHQDRQENLTDNHPDMAAPHPDGTSPPLCERFFRSRDKSEGVRVCLRQTQAKLAANVQVDGLLGLSASLEARKCARTPAKLSRVCKKRSHSCRLVQPQPHTSGTGPARQ